MGLGNFDPFDPGRLQAYAAMQQQVEPAGEEQVEPARHEQAGQIGDEDFQQHLAEERQRTGFIARTAARSAAQYPHLSDRDKSLINSVVAAEVAGGHLTGLTAYAYAAALRRLGNHLGQRGQTIDALDHASLLAHAREFLPSSPHVVPGLNALQRYREAGHEVERHLAKERQGGAAFVAEAPARSDSHYRYLSDTDQDLINSTFKAALAGGYLKARTKYFYALALRKLGNHLGERGQTIDALDHDSLLDYAQACLPLEEHLIPALNILQKYREVEQVGHEGFERHLADAGQGRAAFVAGVATRSDSQYPYLSVVDQDLINATFETAAARRNLDDRTRYFYALALRKFANHLGEGGQTIDALDHDSLLEYAKASLPSEQYLIPGLKAFRRYRDIGREEIERRLAEWRQERAASVAAAPARSDPRCPHLADSDRNLINSAFEAEVTCADLKKATRASYAGALRRLGNHLGERGQTIDALDHDSLVAHAKEFLSKERYLIHALNALQRYREPSIPDGKRRRLDVSVENAVLIDRAIHAAAARWGWVPETVRKYDRALRRLAESLGPGQSMASFDHTSLVAHANRSVPKTPFLRPALQALREYRASNTLADRGPSDQHSSSAEGGDLVHDRIRSNERTEATFPAALNTMRDSDNSSLMAGTGVAVGSWQMRQQAAHSSLQNVDPDKIWQEQDQAGQWPADRWGASNFWKDLPSPVGLPQQSSSPAAAIPARPPRNEFGYLLPLQFNHGPQGAPDVLIGALNRTGLLPGPYQPRINLYLHGLPYTATLGKGVREATPNNPHGDDIILKPRFLGG